MPATEEQVTVVPFGIEADHPRNCDLLIQSIPGVRLRSAISGMRTVKDVETKDDVVPLDQARHLASFPSVKGMQIHVNPAKLTYAVIDPLYEDDDTCDKIFRWMKRQGGISSVKEIRGVEPIEGTIDVHRMKSLCRELVWLLDAGDAKMIKGPRPEMVDVDEMPGRYMLNPGSRVGNTQPVYEDEWDGWVASLSRSGG